MHHNSQNHGHAATLEVNLTLDCYHMNLQNLQTSHHQKMDQSTQNEEYCNTWWHPRSKQKLGDFFTMVKQLYPSASLSRNSVFPYQQPQSKQITPLTKAFSPLRSYKNGPRQWICNFIGLSTGLKKRTYSFIGNQEVKTWGITSRNITHHIAIKKILQPIYIWKMLYLTSTIKLCKDGKMSCSNSAIQLFKVLLISYVLTDTQSSQL